MNKKQISQYAQIVIDLGVNLQKGQDVIIQASTDNIPMAEELTRIAYEKGARHVEILWQNETVQRLKLIHESVETLSQFTAVDKAKMEDQIKRLPVRIYVTDEDPDALKGIDPDKIIKPSMKRGPIIRKYRDRMDGSYQWCIVGMPSLKWAKKMYPKKSAKAAMKAQEKAILHTMRLDTENPMKEWKKHVADLKARAKKMNALKLKSLHYTSSNGTDFTVGLSKDGIWGAAEETQSNGVSSCVNMPTEEVFTSPLNNTAEGIVYSSKPLSWNGNMIEDFSIRFHEGQAVEVKAKKGQKYLEQMIQMDATANRLGEVALVPYDSPINQVGTLFYSTLYDENASCHLALGMGFDECIKGAREMNAKQKEEAHLNKSMIHVDFMVGTRDMKITGITGKGKEVVIFENGVWK